MSARAFLTFWLSIGLAGALAAGCRTPPKPEPTPPRAPASGPPAPSPPPPGTPPRPPAPAEAPRPTPPRGVADDERERAAWKAGRVSLLTEVVLQSKTFDRGFEAILPFLADRETRESTTLAFVGLVGSSPPPSRARALQALREMGRIGLIADGQRQQVMDSVRGRVHEERQDEAWAAAVDAIGILSRDDCGPLVQKTLELAVEDNAPQTVRACADVLGDLGHRPAAAVVVRASDRVRDRFAQRSLLRAMGRIGGNDAIERLRGSLSSASDPLEREAAATALGEAGGPASADALKEACVRNEELVRVRRAAVVALERIAGEDGIRGLEQAASKLRDRGDESARVIARDVQAALERVQKRPR